MAKKKKKLHIGIEGQAKQKILQHHLWKVPTLNESTGDQSTGPHQVTRIRD